MKVSKYKKMIVWSIKLKSMIIKINKKIKEKKRRIKDKIGINKMGKVEVD